MAVGLAEGTDLLGQLEIKVTLAAQGHDSKLSELLKGRNSRQTVAFLTTCIENALAPDADQLQLKKGTVAMEALTESVLDPSTEEFVIKALSSTDRDLRNSAVTLLINSKKVYAEELLTALENGLQKSQGQDTPIAVASYLDRKNLTDNQRERLAEHLRKNLTIDDLLSNSWNKPEDRSPLVKYFEPDYLKSNLIERVTNSDDNLRSDLNEREKAWRSLGELKLSSDEVALLAERFPRVPIFQTGHGTNEDPGLAATTTLAQYLEHESVKRAFLERIPPLVHKTERNVLYRYKDDYPETNYVKEHVLPHGETDLPFGFCLKVGWKTSQKDHPRGAPVSGPAISAIYGDTNCRAAIDQLCRTEDQDLIDRFIDEIAFTSFTDQLYINHLTDQIIVALRDRGEERSGSVVPLGKEFWIEGARRGNSSLEAKSFEKLAKMELTRNDLEVLTQRAREIVDGETGRDFYTVQDLLLNNVENETVRAFLTEILRDCADAIMFRNSSPWGEIVNALAPWVSKESAVRDALITRYQDEKSKRNNESELKVISKNLDQPEVLETAKKIATRLSAWDCSNLFVALADHLDKEGVPELIVRAAFYEYHVQDNVIAQLIRKLEGANTGIDSPAFKALKNTKGRYDGRAKALQSLVKGAIDRDVAKMLVVQGQKDSDHYQCTFDCGGYVLLNNGIVDRLAYPALAALPGTEFVVDELQNALTKGDKNQRQYATRVYAAVERETGQQ